MSSNLPSKMVFDKELEEEQLELIKRQYLKIASLNKLKMDSVQYQLFLDKDKDMILPKDYLLHGTKFDITKLRSIKKNGILGGEFIGKKKNGTNYYCADFYKVLHDTKISLYDSNFKEDDKFPFNGVNDNLAFIIKPTSKIGALLYYDLYDSKFDNNLMVRDIITLEENNNNDLVSIIAGIPSNTISGIVLGDMLLLDDYIINEIKKLFPNAFLVSRQGIIIRDRSNVVKIEDYENITLKYAKLLVKEKKLEEERDKERREFKKYASSVVKNVSNYEQAKILLDYGYKEIPSHLKEKLTKREIDKLS